MKNRKSTKNFKAKHPREIGKFYRILDKNNGHPGQVFFCDVDNDLYLLVKFTSKKNKDRVKLKHNIDPNSSKEQYAHKRPFALSYDQMQYTESYLSFRIHPDDKETIDLIRKRNPK